jgi:hypothetical protein
LKDVRRRHAGDNARDPNAVSAHDERFHPNSKRTTRSFQNAITQGADEGVPRFDAEIAPQKKRHKFIRRRLARENRIACGGAFRVVFLIERTREAKKFGRNINTRQLSVGGQTRRWYLLRRDEDLDAGTRTNLHLRHRGCRSKQRRGC